MPPDEERRARLLRAAAGTPGFLVEEEALALHDLAAEAAASALGPLLEVGGYLGRSSLYLAAAIAGYPVVLYSVDHHHGSEEMQPGWEHHDPTTVDAANGAHRHPLALARRRSAGPGPRTSSSA